MGTRREEFSKRQVLPGRARRLPTPSSATPSGTIRVVRSALAFPSAFLASASVFLAAALYTCWALQARLQSFLSDPTPGSCHVPAGFHAAAPLGGGPLPDISVPVAL